MILLLTLLGLAAEPTATGPDAALSEPREASVAARGASAARLRAMLGAHAEGPPLSRDQVLAVLDGRHPKIAAATLAVDVARAGMLGSRSVLDPVLHADGKRAVQGYYDYTFADAALSWSAGPASAHVGYRIGVGGDGGGVPDYYGEYETLDGGEVRVGASLGLLEGLTVNSDLAMLRVARLGVRASDADRLAVQVGLRAKATGSWAKWVSAGRQLALEQALLDIARTRQRAVEARISLGDLAAIERIRALQIVAEREAALAEARGGFVAATESLALYVRDEGGAPVRVGIDRLPDRVGAPEGAAGYDVDPVHLAVTIHPTLEAMRADVAAREIEARVARNGLLPDLRLSVEHARDLGEPTIDSLAPPTTLVGVKAKVPMLNLKDRGKARQADAKVAKARADLAWATEQVEARVRSALAREDAALAAWRAAAQTVDLALQLQEAEQRRFDVGDIDLLRLWQVEQGTAKAIRTEIKEWAAYQVALAELEAAVGQPAQPSSP